MALWMEEGAAPRTDSERADLDAIAAIKEAAAIELKEKGNQFVKMGKNHYADSIDCYTRAINQRCLSESENSILFSNRAHVNLLLGNYKRALLDAEEAIKLCSTNIKAFYRAAKASLSLNMLDEAALFCRSGLEQFPSNEELKKLAEQVKLRKLEAEHLEAHVMKAVSVAKDLASAFARRGLKLGKAMYRELTGIRKPFLDNSSILHWPVLLLYPEVMYSDLIDDFCETDMFSTHLDEIFSENCSPLPWDKDGCYTREAIELYYEAGSGIILSKRELYSFLLEGTAGAKFIDKVCEENEADASVRQTLTSDITSSKWIKVDERKTLYAILRQSDNIIHEIPVFYLVSNRSAFYKKFRAGKWILP